MAYATISFGILSIVRAGGVYRTTAYGVDGCGSLTVRRHFGQSCRSRVADWGSKDGSGLVFLSLRFRGVS